MRAQQVCGQGGCAQQWAKVMISNSQESVKGGEKEHQGLFWGMTEDDEVKKLIVQLELRAAGQAQMRVWFGLVWFGLVWFEARLKGGFGLFVCLKEKKEMTGEVMVHLYAQKYYDAPMCTEMCDAPMCTEM
jgi:hypothetical protein